MTNPVEDALIPSILVVDDERQIHSSLRLRLGECYRVNCQFRPQEALELIRRQCFDLCITDVHMPTMDGLSFIEAARSIDPALGYVVLSGHDTDENLRRAIPLQILDFIPKPLPGRSDFEARIPDWIAATRHRRREMSLAKDAAAMVHDLELARIERDVESTASESAREALLQAATHLTTLSALLHNANHQLAVIDGRDLKLAPLARCLKESARIAEDAALITDTFFASAYADRETSTPLINSSLQHGIAIARRLARSEERRQQIDLTTVGRELTLAGISGLDFLLLFVPALIQSLELAANDMTVQVLCKELVRMDEVLREPSWRSLMWVNRRNALSSSPGVAVAIKANVLPVEEAVATEWLKDGTTKSLKISTRGILQGIIKAKGILGLAIQPQCERHEIVFVLPI